LASHKEGEKREGKKMDPMEKKLAKASRDSLQADAPNVWVGGGGLIPAGPGNSKLRMCMGELKRKEMSSIQLIKMFGGEFA